MGVVFAKTPKGHDEIATKSGGLSPRVRRLLIFVDGKRSVEELRGMLPADDLQHTLGMLEEEGYIEFHNITGIPPGAATPTVLPSITAFSELPGTLDPVRLQQARNFMINTVNTIFGQHNRISLVESIYGSKTTEELRHVYIAWAEAMESNAVGKRRLPELLEKLFAVL